MTSVTHTLVAAKPILLCTRSGTATEGGGEGGGARGVLLNSHTDVVPAEAAKWSVPPFAAAELNGSIYARGVQDMKVWGMGRLGGGGGWGWWGKEGAWLEAGDIGQRRTLGGLNEGRSGARQGLWRRRGRSRLTGSHPLAAVCCCSRSCARSLLLFVPLPA